MWKQRHFQLLFLHSLACWRRSWPQWTNTWKPMAECQSKRLRTENAPMNTRLVERTTPICLIANIMDASIDLFSMPPVTTHMYAIAIFIEDKEGHNELKRLALFGEFYNMQLIVYHHLVPGLYQMTLDRCDSYEHCIKFAFEMLHWVQCFSEWYSSVLHCGGGSTSVPVRIVEMIGW